MTDNEIDLAFGSITPEHPIWKGVAECLQQYVDESVGDAAMLGLDDSKRQFFAGKLNNAIYIRDQMFSRMERVQSSKFTGPSSGDTEA